MKKDILVYIILIATIGTSINLSAQSTEDIIRKHIAVTGGDTNWEKIQTISISGSMMKRGNTIYVTKNIIKDTCIRNDMTIQYPEAGRSDKKYYIILNENKGWSYLPEERNNTIFALEESEVNELKDELDYEDPFIRYNEKGRDINMLGIEYDKGVEYYKFSIQYKSGKLIYCYVNTETMLIDKIESMHSNEVVMLQYLMYKKLPEGITMATKIVSDEGELNIHSIKINTPMSKELFQPSDKNNFNYRH